MSWPGSILPGGEDGLANESKVLTLGAYGEDMDLYAMKGAVEAILKDIRAGSIHFEGPARRALQRLLSSRPVCPCPGGRQRSGRVRPDPSPDRPELRRGRRTLLRRALLPRLLFAVKGADPQYVPLPKFPAVTRDIAVVCDEAVTVGALEVCIRKGAKGLLKDAALFDIYRGKGIPEGKKSVAFNLVLRADDRSLTAEEADADVKSILETLEKELGAVLR